MSLILRMKREIGARPGVVWPNIGLAHVAACVTPLSTQFRRQDWIGADRSLRSTERKLGKRKKKTVTSNIWTHI